MNPLYHHIEQLLLSNPCVVIPQFGAFVAMDAPACYVESEQLFFPPVRHVRFNADITADDGLLVTAVAHREVCSTTDAKRLIQSWVLDLRQQLLTDTQVEINSLGTLEQDEDGYLTFEACQSGITLPEYFGLDAFNMPRLSEHAIHQQRIHHTKNDHITIHIHKRTLRTTVAVVACVILCLVFSKPISENISQFNLASFFQDSSATEPATSVVPTTIATHKTQTAPSTQVVAHPAETAPAAQEDQTIQEVQVSPESIEPIESSETTTTVTSPSFGIVVACAPSMKYAECYAEYLQQRGFIHAYVVNTGKVIRVIIDTFTSEAEAYIFNQQLHESSDEFATSWVLSL